MRTKRPGRRAFKGAGPAGGRGGWGGRRRPGCASASDGGLVPINGVSSSTVAAIIARCSTVWSRAALRRKPDRLEQRATQLALEEPSAGLADLAADRSPNPTVASANSAKTHRGLRHWGGAVVRRRPALPSRAREHPLKQKHESIGRYHRCCRAVLNGSSDAGDGNGVVSTVLGHGQRRPDRHWRFRDHSRSRPSCRRRQPDLRHFETNP